MLSWKGKEGVVKMHGAFLETPAWITRALGHEVVKNQAGYWRVRHDLADIGRSRMSHLWSIFGIICAF